jgi:ABC-2 type transport system permease protein
MKIVEIIIKSAREQLRNFWILLLTLVMAPIFVGIYYLLSESTKPSYDLVFLNKDRGVQASDSVIRHGDELIKTAKSLAGSTKDMQITINQVNDISDAQKLFRQKKADVLITFPEGFSDSLMISRQRIPPAAPKIEFMGDMSDFNYMIAAIWGSEIIRIYIETFTGFPSPFVFAETNLVKNSGMSDFDLYMPGLLVLSVIMLMFSASIAFVNEVENGTILRYRLSGLSSFEFIAGVSVIQLIVGIVSMLMTLGTAILLGYQYNGSILWAIVVIGLVSLSIIAFSVLLAAATRNSNEILVIGNFPLFLFMFFTGAAFPMEGKALFRIAGYGINLQGLMSPTHGVSAMKKILTLDFPPGDIVPEIIAIVILTIVYFALGIWLFNKRHMKFGG